MRKREKNKEKERKREKKREKREKKKVKYVQGQLLSICIQFSKRKTNYIEMLEISKTGLDL